MVKTPLGEATLLLLFLLPFSVGVSFCSSRSKFFPVGVDSIFEELRPVQVRKPEVSEVVSYY